VIRPVSCVAAGKLSYTDTLADVLPDYPNVQAAQTVTIDHLLTHTAGLRGLFEQPRYNRQARYRTSAAFFPVFAQQPLLFVPGTEVSYSNEGYIVLGAVIERLAGQSYKYSASLSHCQQVRIEKTETPGFGHVSLVNSWRFRIGVTSAFAALAMVEGPYLFKEPSQHRCYP
jgi:hypothetical protein